jgi:hypothetical protein
MGGNKGVLNKGAWIRSRVTNCANHTSYGLLISTCDKKWVRQDVRSPLGYFYFVLYVLVKTLLVATPKNRQAISL